MSWSRPSRTSRPAGWAPSPPSRTPATTCSSADRLWLTLASALPDRVALSGRDRGLSRPPAALVGAGEGVVLVGDHPLPVLLAQSEREPQPIIGIACEALGGVAAQQGKGERDIVPGGDVQGDDLEHRTR